MKSRHTGDIGNNQKNLSKKLQNIQNELDKVSKEIEEMNFIGKSGGEAIEVIVKGDKTPIKIEIKESEKESLKEDLPMLFDLIIAALKDGFQKIDEYTDKEIGKVTKGLPMPIPGLS